METISELRKKLQEEKVNPEGWKRPWGYKSLQRGPSIYITHVLLKTKITANQVTILSILFGIAGSLLLLGFEWYIKLLGVTFVYLGILFDKVDGEIARYRKTFSLKGIFWDEVNHLVVPPLFWICLTFGITELSFISENILIPLAVLGALSLGWIRTLHSLPAQIYAKKYIKHPEYFPLTNSSSQMQSNTKKTHSLKKTLSVLRPLSIFIDFFVITCITALALVLERLFFKDWIFHPILLYMVFSLSILFVFFACKIALQTASRVEKDIHSRNNTLSHS